MARNLRLESEGGIYHVLNRSSVAWLVDPRRRRAWYDPAAALAHAGNLVVK